MGYHEESKHKWLLMLNDVLILGYSFAVLKVEDW